MSDRVDPRDLRIVLEQPRVLQRVQGAFEEIVEVAAALVRQIGRASCRERV